MSTKPVVHPRLLPLLLLALWASPTLAADPPAESSFVTKALDFLGISATPGSQKGLGDELEEGDVWMVQLSSGLRIRLTREGGYRSPVFVPGDEDIVALKGDDILRVPAFGGQPEKLQSLPGVTKIVGFQREDPDKALMLLEGEKDNSVGVLSLQSGKLTPIPYGKSGEDRRMLTHLKGWERVYDSTNVYVKTETFQDEGGRTRERSDVYVEQSDEAPVNVSRCDGAHCGQPSLSPDGDRVVYVKSEE